MAEKNWLNQRFYNEIKRRKLLHSLSQTESKFYDAKNGELIAKSISFWRGTPIWAFNTFDELRQSLGLGWETANAELMANHLRILSINIFINFGNLEKTNDNDK